MKIRQASSNYYLYALKPVELFGRVVHFELYVNNLLMAHVLPDGRLTNRRPNSIQLNGERIKRELAVALGR